MKCFRLTLNLIGIIHEPGENTYSTYTSEQNFPFFFEKKIKIDDFMAFFFEN